MGIEHRIGAHLLVGGNAHHAALALRVRNLAVELDYVGRDGRVGGRLGGAAIRFRGVGIHRRAQGARGVHFAGVDFHPIGGHAAPQECRAANVRDVAERRALMQAARDFPDLPLGIAVHQQIRLGVHQHGAAHRLGPIIEMRNAPQAGLDAAQHDGDGLEGLAQPLRIHDDASIGTPAAGAARGIGIVAAHPPVGGVAIHHRVHVAAGHAEEQPRRAQCLEVAGAAPVGLGDDADLEALRLQDPADDGHAEAGVIHIGIAGDDDDIALLPSERVHFGARSRQERRRRVAGGGSLEAGK
jgi:hypothetical protein